MVKSKLIVRDHTVVVQESEYLENMKRDTYEPCFIKKPEPAEYAGEGEVFVGSRKWTYVLIKIKCEKLVCMVIRHDFFLFFQYGICYLSKFSTMVILGNLIREYFVARDKWKFCTFGTVNASYAIYDFQRLLANIFRR